MSGLTPRFRQVVPVIFVPSVEAAVAYYVEKLGFTVSFTSEYDYAGVNRDGVELHLGKGSPCGMGERGAHIYFFVQNLDAVHAEFTASGAVDGQIKEQEYGLRELHLTDPFGYHLAFAEPMEQ